MAHLQQSQNNPSDSEAIKSLTSVEYYNLHIRKEGEKVIATQKELDEIRARHNRNMNPDRKQETDDLFKSIEELKKKYS